MIFTVPAVSVLAQIRGIGVAREALGQVHVFGRAAFLAAGQQAFVVKQRLICNWEWRGLDSRISHAGAGNRRTLGDKGPFSGSRRCFFAV